MSELAFFYQLQQCRPPVQQIKLFVSSLFRLLKTQMQAGLQKAALTVSDLHGQFVLKPGLCSKGKTQITGLLEPNIKNLKEHLAADYSNSHQVHASMQGKL